MLVSGVEFSDLSLTYTQCLSQQVSSLVPITHARPSFYSMVVIMIRSWLSSVGLAVN